VVPSPAQQRALYHRIGQVAQAHADLEMRLYGIWTYFLPEADRHRRALSLSR
jgi:hypothetical protein